MPLILTINIGSSSLKCSIYSMGDTERLVIVGSMTRIGTTSGRFSVVNGQGQPVIEETLVLPDHGAAVRRLLNWIIAEAQLRHLDAVGHRVVHGGTWFTQPTPISEEMLSTLTSLTPLAPEHLPHQIAAIHAIEQALPDAQQVACFDTAFHHQMPAVAKHYALPKRLTDAGIVRYGFHGLSYEYIVSALCQASGDGTANGRIIIAHLGNGASMVAVLDGRSIDTTMGFTPTGGLVMGTRSGDLDPGVILYAIEELGLDPATVRRLVSHQAGLLGVSGSSGDMGELLRQETVDAQAVTAIALFCYQARKFLGSLATVLGGIDTLIFTAGIGEHIPAIRARVCAGLEFLGIALDPARNEVNAPLISRDDSPTAVRVMRTNEELMIARHTAAALRQRQRYVEAH
ncbi:MAG TPA: acetate/propionate family kinase [Ktedonobacterales bacterium]|nr:acetate/propionate family kinase [Ktedonobacterales bacterium]